MNYTNKTVIITGGASGIGLLCGQCFAKEGANVVLVDINQEAAETKAKEICDNGGNALGVASDVRDYEQVTLAVKAAADKFGTIDVMINCAGGAEARIFDKGNVEFKDMPIEVYDWGIDVNLKGQLYFDHAVMKYMAKQRSGVIIHIGSITGEEGCETNVAYSTAKSAAMNGLTKSLAQYGSLYNVRVVCVSPGPVLTREAMGAMKTLLGRAAETQEIVKLIMFLASDDASFITGCNYMIDGGRAALKRKWGY